VQLVEPVRDVRVVLEVGGMLRAAVAERPPQRIDRQERPELARRSEEVGTLEAARSFGERREREPVPGGDDLVVEGRLRPPLANLQQACPGLLV